MHPKSGSGSSWWLVEVKTLLSIPLILASVLFVCFNMTIAFLLEAFIARIYDGPMSFIAVGSAVCPNNTDAD